MPLEQSQMNVLEKSLDHQYVELLEEVREELAQSGDSEYVELLGRGGADTGEEAVRDLLWGLNSALFDRPSTYASEACTTFICTVGLFRPGIALEISESIDLSTDSRDPALN